MSLTECYRAGTGERLINSHVSGRENHTLELHKLLSLHFLSGELLKK